MLMNLYCIANIGKRTVLSVNGDWLSFRGTKSNLRNVCWFANSAEAQKRAAMFTPRNVSVVSAKTLMKKMGLKHIPGYVAENYQGSMFSRMYGERQGDEEARSKRVEVGRDAKTAAHCNSGRGQEERIGEGNGRIDEITVIPMERPSLELRVEDDTLGSSVIVEEIQSVLEALSGASGRWDRLAEDRQKRLREIELREIDLLHIIEFYLPKEETMVYLYRTLHDLRMERRRVKNELSALSTAIRAAKSIPKNTLAYALGGIDQIKNQKYKCRTIPAVVPEWLSTVLAENNGKREENNSESG